MSRFMGGGNLPATPRYHDLLKGFIGGFLGIFGLGLLASLSGKPLLIAPFGATCVILFAASTSPLAQPRNVIGGHLISSLVGLCAVYFFGGGILVMAVSVGVAIAAMQYLRVVHPPAGANPLLIILAGAGAYHIDFMLFPILLGSLFLVGVAAIVNNIGLGSKWPAYWHGISWK